MKFMIDNFGVTNLFGRENYEYYARITGRILKVDDDWIFSFGYSPDALASRKLTARIVYSIRETPALTWFGEIHRQGTQDV